MFTERSFVHNGKIHTVPIHFAGMIDRGFENEDGSISLMELKTGKWKQKWDKKKNQWADDRYKVQGMRKEMAFYVDLLKMADHPYKTSLTGAGSTLTVHVEKTWKGSDS